MLSPLPSTTLIAGRYEIDRVAGSGGMGIVYRALDLYNDEWVALKVLRNSAGNLLGPRRFSREMHILSELHHPGIVSHLASGQTSEGLEYLVMEWLEGEELTDRMNRGALSIYEARQLLRQVGEALACAHQLGVVHRDIKPSNLFLCNKQFGRVVLLDFGVAYHRRPITQTALTQLGTVIGTLAYMSPEQARADQSITAAADIYSLGRVIYQGLSGQKRREPEHLAAALAQAIFDETPPLARICPWIPEPLSGLVARMLSKDPTRRPADGTALLGELASLGPLPGMALPPVDDSRAAGSGLSDEQSLYTIVLTVSVDGAVSRLDSAGEKLHPEIEERQQLEATLMSHHATPRWLLDGSLLLTMALSDSAHDQALRAARCALIIKARWPATAIAVTTGRGQLARQELLGEVVDRAARLLRERERLTLENPRAAAIESGSIWVDELSASLLDRRFVLVPVQGAALLTGELLASEETRPVLGTVPPCMGREVELTILETIIKRCRDDSEPQAVLVTAPPGLGKTRLRQEFLNRLRRRSWPCAAMLGVGEILSAGAPYALLGQALRQLCAIPRGDSPAAAWQHLTGRCTALLGAEEGERVALFLGELCGLPFPGGDPPELRAARGDSKALSAHFLHAFTALIGACCAHSPVILILDDLHWADALTIQLVDRALRELQGRPFMVMALGRPEVKTAFPKVRQWPHVKDLPLDGLSRAASERIVRFVLGSVIESSTMAHIVQHAGGNPLLLEELIRAESESQGSQVSATVLAILQARMQRLELKVRLMLGQASIFGQRFWRGGLQSIREAAPLDLEVDVVLQSLVRAELITAHRQSCFPGEYEYSFRHPLMREAAYSLLLEDQKQRWHRIAGQYLERVGEPKALVLAEHFRRSDERSRCIPYFTRVARLALDGNDLAGARTYADWALEAKPEGEARGDLLSIQAAILYRSQKH